jgi:2-methylisocitrate lyase-like PEP mutase family enzyme
MTMDPSTLAALAERLISLHRPGDPLVLVNAWDAASARAIAGAGAPVIATSSAAIAAVLGEPDDDRMDVDLVFDMVRRISTATPLPVTADVEAGYGLEPDELIARLIAAGAVGCNVEDSDHRRPGEQVPADAFAERLAGIREAADAVGVHVVLNARIDTFLLGTAGANAVEDVLARGRQYLAAGADCVYPIRLVDPAVVAELAGALGGPLNANVAPGAAISELAGAGAARISVGPRGQYVAMERLATFAAEVLGTVP